MEIISGIHALTRDAETVLGERPHIRRQALFVILTFLGMIIGLLGSLLDQSTWLIWGSYGVAFVCGGWYGLKESIRSLRIPAVEIDLLMILAATGALLIGAPFEGAMLLFLFSLSGVLEEYAIGRSRTAIKSLIDIRPEEAMIQQNGHTMVTHIDDVEVGDIYLIKPGDRLPLDGVVESGESTIDQSSLTGESVPVPKGPGDDVFSGTINETGSLEIRVTKESHESAISRLIHMVEEAQGKRAPTQQLIDRYEQPYVLSVFGFTALAFLIPYVFLQHTFEPTVYRAMTIMVAASPCAVIISTPAAVLSAISAGGRQGILFKGGEHLETAGSVNAIAFDKTGTLTEGNTRLTDVIPLSDNGDITQDDVLSFAAGVQAKSEHHLAEATVSAAEEKDVHIPATSAFSAVVGKGVHASIDESTIHIGNIRYVDTVLEEAIIDNKDAGIERLRALEADGKTSVLVIRESRNETTVLGVLAFTDTIRSDAAETIEKLRESGVERIVMLTGDNRRVAEYIGQELDIDEVYAELLPEEKVTHIERLQETYDAVAMVGDGVNDAPALATADISIGMGGAGTDVALETADIVLMSDRLDRLPFAFDLSKETKKTLYINFAIAFGAIAIMIIAILTAGIPLPVAVVGHEGSTVLVSLIGLRLLGYQG